MAGSIKHAAEFIRAHGIFPSPQQRFKGVRDTVLGWCITAFTFAFFEMPTDPYVASVSFLIKFFSGAIALIAYVLIDSLCSGDGFRGMEMLLIREYNETVTEEIHLTVKQRKKFIYSRCLISAGSYIFFYIARFFFGPVDNAEIIGADPLIYAIIASYIFLHRRIFLEKIGMVLAAVGVCFLLFFDFTTFSWQFGLISGVSGILSALFFSIIFFITSIIVRHDTPIRIAFYNSVVGMILAALVLVVMCVIKIAFSTEFLAISFSIIRDSVVVGILYTISVVLFLRAFIYTEPVIIAMLGYSLSIFSFLFGWLFKGEISNYKTMIGSGFITIGCTILIYAEYLKSMLENKEDIERHKPIYKESMKNKLIVLEEKFHLGKLKKYQYIDEKHEYNKLLVEYSKLICGSIISKIEILENELLFTFKPYDVVIQTDGGARSAPFEILNFGSYEPEDEAVAYSLIRNGDTILDAGAHVGWYSINIAKRFPESKIYAFEPVKETFEVLKKNIGRNNVTNVFTYNYGFSEKEEDKGLFYFKGGSAIASIGNLLSHKKAKKVKCHLKSVDQTMKELQLNSLDFIKCDVEGAELLFLRGAGKTIDKHKPIILIEIYEEWCKKLHYSSHEITNFLFSRGYEIFRSNNGCLKHIEEPNFMDDEKYNYFFLHKQKHSKMIKGK